MSTGERRAHFSLREVAEADLDALFEHQSDADAAAMAAFPSRERRAFFDHWHRILVDPTVIARTIVCDDEVAGNAVSWIQDDHREIGYWIGKPYWGRGIASEAVARFIELVVDRPLYAYVATHNTGSIRVLEKAGFVRDGQHEDHLIYKLD